MNLTRLALVAVIFVSGLAATHSPPAHAGLLNCKVSGQAKASSSSNSITVVNKAGKTISWVSGGIDGTGPGAWGSDDPPVPAFQLYYSSSGAKIEQAVAAADAANLTAIDAGSVKAGTTQRGRLSAYALDTARIRVVYTKGSGMCSKRIANGQTLTITG